MPGYTALHYARYGESLAIMPAYRRSGNLKFLSVPYDDENLYFITLKKLHFQYAEATKIKQLENL